MRTKEYINKFELAEKEYANSNSGVRELSKKYNLTRGELTGWLLAKGYALLNKRASKLFNQNYFDSIDSEEKAYWLGFLFADGSLNKYKNSYKIEFCLKKSDSQHVELFAKAINKEYVNNTSSYRTRCCVGSKHMFETLTKYGCTEKKSLTLKFPNKGIFKDSKLIIPFIRGYVDGDGCISYKNKEHTSMLLNILGTKDFLDNIQIVLNTKQKYKNANDNQDITKSLTYSGKTAYKLLKTLYENANVYLERKYEKYKEICRLYEKS